jgi:hypothetical protein
VREPLFPNGKTRAETAHGGAARFSEVFSGFSARQGEKHPAVVPRMKRSVLQE